MDFFDVQFYFKECMERMGIDYVTEAYGKSVMAMINGLSDDLIIDIFRDASREYDESKKLPPESWWRKFIGSKRASWNCISNCSRKNVVEYRSEDDVEEFKRRCREIAHRFGYSETKKVSLVKAKEERLRGYVSQDLVRIDSIFHPMHGEWVSRSEACGLNYVDAVTLLIEHLERQDIRNKRTPVDREKRRASIFQSVAQSMCENSI